jgi:hypothetical protein
MWPNISNLINLTGEKQTDYPGNIPCLHIDTIGPTANNTTAGQEWKYNPVAGG